MIFKSFKWPVEPKTINVSMSKNLKTDFLPHIGIKQTAINRSYKIISGNGELKGENCSKQFAQLADIFIENSSGQLIIPSFAPIQAFFVELSITSSNSADSLNYKFKFIEDCSHKSSDVTATNQTYYTIKNHESLWEVAKKFNIYIEDLIQKNPHIPSPYSTKPGDKIKL